jgi:hypothetical protein
MNPWIALAVAGRAITDERLKAAWTRMLETHHPDDCVLVQEVADDLAGHVDYWRLAWRAEEYARAEQALVHALLKMGVSHD